MDLSLPAMNTHSQESDFEEGSDEIAIGLGVVDAKDKAVNSSFSVWDLALTGAGGVEEGEEEEGGRISRRA